MQATPIWRSNTGAGTSTPTLITFMAGVWTGPVTFFGAGASVRLTCTDFSVAAAHRNQRQHHREPGVVRRAPGAPARRDARRAAPPTARTGRRTPRRRARPFPITVRAVDAYWNVVSGISDRVALARRTRSRACPPRPRSVSGQLVFPGRLYKSGTQTITAHDATTPAIADNTSGNVTIVGGSVRAGAGSGARRVAGAGHRERAHRHRHRSVDQLRLHVTVLATDQWWNPVTGPTDVVHITCGDPLAQVAAGPGDGGRSRGHGDAALDRRLPADHGVAT